MQADSLLRSGCCIPSIFFDNDMYTDYTLCFQRIRLWMIICHLDEGFWKDTSNWRKLHRSVSTWSLIESNSISNQRNADIDEVNFIPK